MSKKRWPKLIILISIPLVCLGIYIHSLYRGFGSFPLRTAEVNAFKRDMKQHGFPQISVTYRAPRTIEIICKKEFWKESDTDIVKAGILQMAQNKTFLNDYSQKYRKRYRCTIEESYPQVIMLYFKNKGESLPVFFL